MREPLMHAVNAEAVSLSGRGPRPIRIEDPADPRIAPFRDIRERDLARAGSFIAEGTVVLEALLDSPFFRAVSLFVLRNRLGGLEPLLGRLPAGVPVLVAEREAMDAAAGFAVHRGVLALAERRPEIAMPTFETLAGARRPLVVAVGIANHDNMGGIFRNASAFGAGAVLLDPSSCDPLYRKAVRVSAGAVLRVPFGRVPVEDLADRLRLSGYRPVALSPSGRSDVAALGASAEPVALFLGTEGEGLPADLMAAMETVRIAMAPGFDSLNVATSAAIALHRLYPSVSPDSPA